MLNIYGHAESSNVQKVLWCCDELRLAYARHDIGGRFGGNRSADYLALNPTGLVPTIDDDGFVLWESNSIVRYLATRHGRGSLWPQDEQVAASASRWMDWQLSVIQPLMREMRRAFQEEGDGARRERPALLARAATHWKILDAQLSHTAYVASDQLSVGDIALGNVVHRWFKLELEARPALPALEAWYHRLRARPAYMKNIGKF
jgi:glutathione S-transferase